MRIFSDKVNRPDEDMTLGKKMSHTSHAINEAKRAQAGSADKSKAISVMQRSLSELKSYAIRQESGFERFIRRLLNLFGIATNYQRLMDQIDHLEASANKLTEDESEHLQKLHVQKEKVQKKIGREVRILNKQFTEIEEAIEELKTKAKKLTSVDRNFSEIQEIVSHYQRHLRDMKRPINAMAQIYQGDIGEFDLIPSLWKRYTTAERELREIANALSELIKPSEPASTRDVRTPPVVSIGGIYNGGNTCYLASALQAINSAKPYRDLFNPVKNPLDQRLGESDSSFQERQLIQKRGFDILEKISGGSKVSTSEINAFRSACHSHKFNGSKRVIKSLIGQTDSLETVNRLLTVLDYKQGPLMFKYEHEFSDEDDYEVVSPFESSGIPRNPKDYMTLEEAKSYTMEGELTLSAYPYLNGSASMNTLLKDFWKDETLDTYLVKHVDEGSGAVTYRKYKNVPRKVSLDLDKTKMPKVLEVKIQQLAGNKATVTHPEVIYPSGKVGVGPRYRLASGIEHLPGHYVAHIITPTGVIQANDGWVHPDANSSFPGNGYYYVLDE